MRQQSLHKIATAGNNRAMTTNNIVNLNREGNRPVRGLAYQGICGVVNVTFEWTDGVRSAQPAQGFITTTCEKRWEERKRLAERNKSTWWRRNRVAPPDSPAFIVACGA